MVPKTSSKMNNERRKTLKEVLTDLQQFVDGKVPEAEALEALNGPSADLFNCLFDEKESRDNLMEVIPSGPKVDKAIKCVYELEDAYDDIQAVKQHLQDNDAEYKGSVEVYIKSAIEHIKKSMEK